MPAAAAVAHSPAVAAMLMTLLAALPRAAPPPRQGLVSPGLGWPSQAPRFKARAPSQGGVSARHSRHQRCGATGVRAVCSRLAQCKPYCLAGMADKESFLLRIRDLPEASTPAGKPKPAVTCCLGTCR